MPAKKTDNSDRSKPAGVPPQAVASTVRRGLFQPMTLWWLACALLAVVFLPYLPWMTPELSTRPEYQIGWEQIQVTPPPKGVPEQIVRDVRTSARLPENFSLLQPGLARQLGEAFKAHPWVANVDRVEIRRQRRIDIDLSYRRAALIVETSRGYYPVDTYGVLLPPGDFVPEDIQRLPLCRNVKTLPQEGAGAIWGDLVVDCAARLAEVLAPQGDMNKHWKRLNIVAIMAPVPASPDVIAEDLSFDLVTRGGSVIRWGRVPGADLLEPSAEQKLARLSQIVQSQGSLDPPGGPFRFDIRHEVISQQALDQTRGSILR